MLWSKAEIVKISEMSKQNVKWPRFLDKIFYFDLSPGKTSSDQRNLDKTVQIMKECSRILLRLFMIIGYKTQILS